MMDAHIKRNSFEALTVRRLELAFRNPLIYPYQSAQTIARLRP